MADDLLGSLGNYDDKYFRLSDFQSYECMGACATLSDRSQKKSKCDKSNMWHIRLLNDSRATILFLP